MLCTFLNIKLFLDEIFIVVNVEIIIIVIIKMINIFFNILIK